jgi:hypothetical protein
MTQPEGSRWTPSFVWAEATMKDLRKQRGLRQRGWRSGWRRVKPFSYDDQCDEDKDGHHDQTAQKYCHLFGWCKSPLSTHCSKGGVRPRAHNGRVAPQWESGTGMVPREHCTRIKTERWRRRARHRPLCEQCRGKLRKEKSSVPVERGLFPSRQSAVDFHSALIARLRTTVAEALPDIMSVYHAAIEARA